MKRIVGLIAAFVLVGSGCATDEFEDGRAVGPPTSDVAAAGTAETAPSGAADSIAADQAPSTAAQLVPWIGVRLSGLGNGDVNGRYPSFGFDNVDVDTDRVSMFGNDGCNIWSAAGTIIDGRFEFVDGHSTTADCGPGTFSVRDGDIVEVSDDNIIVTRGDLTYSFGPDAVVADATTLLDQRRFIEVSSARPFPMSIEFDEGTASGFDGCETFVAAAEYRETSVQLTEVESRCATDMLLDDGDEVEHVGSNTAEVRRDDSVIVGPLVAIGESFVPPTAEWLIGDWLLGSGRVRFENGRVSFGRCETDWRFVGGVVEIDGWDGCVTGLFPGEPDAEATLRAVVGSPLVHRLLPPLSDDEFVEGASVLDAGHRSVRLVRMSERPPSSGQRTFALEAVDGIEFVGAAVPVLATSGATFDWIRGRSDCGEFSLRRSPDATSFEVEELLPPEPCLDVPAASGFVPGPGTSVTVDGQRLTAVDSNGRTAVYVEISALEQAFVSDLLDPTSGTAEWGVDGLTIELTGRPGFGVMRIGSCERAWTFDATDIESIGFGSLRVDDADGPLDECAGAEPTPDARALLDLLGRTQVGDGADIRLVDDSSIYLIWDVLAIRLDR